MVPARIGEPATSRVAVVIPCFNDGEFVREAVNSALAQEACEIVVVDDGSDDPATIEMVASLPETVRVVRQANQGPSAARMTGVAATAARYVQPLDSDDRLASGALTVLADALDADPSATAAWGYTLTFGQAQAKFMHWSGFDPWRLTFLNEVPAPLLVRRDALLAVGGWDADDQEGANFEDWDLNLKGAEAGWTGIRVDHPHTEYRQHANPRRLDQSIRRYDDLRAMLRGRHPGLFDARRRTRRLSPSRRRVKLTWTLIDALPLTSEFTKGKLFNLTRDTFEPEMKASDVPSLGQRIKSRVTPQRRSKVGDTASRTRG